MNVITDRQRTLAEKQSEEGKKKKVTSYLEVVDVTSGERKVLHEFDRLIEAPNWKRNGNELIYNSEGYIYCYDIEKDISTRIDTGICIRCNNDHVLSPDNTKIAVSHHTYEDGQSRIYVIPIVGGEPVLITPIAPSYLHGWSPEGTSLAYCAERNGEYDIYTIPVLGGIETRLTDAPGLDDGPEYSPCGKDIWFNSVRSGLMQIWRMKKDGSDQTQVTFDEGNSWFPHVSPDGKMVAYITYKKGDVAPGDHPANKDVEIRIMPVDGKPTTLVKLFGGQGTLNVNSWSPDSTKLAFVSYKKEN